MLHAHCSARGPSFPSFEFLALGVNVFCELYSAVPARLLSLQTDGEVTGASQQDLFSHKSNLLGNWNALRSHACLWALSSRSSFLKPVVGLSLGS